MATGGKNDKPILIDLAAVSFIHAIDRKYIIKYINKLNIKTTRVESMKDWKKKAKAKTFIAQKKSTKYR
jgi:Holliday junction resolvase